MFKNMRLPLRAGIACWLTLLAPSVMACISCGCTVDTDAIQSPTTGTGVTTRLDWTWIDQNQLMHQTHHASWDQVANQPSDAFLGGGEIETETRTLITTADVGIKLSPTLRLNVVVPWVDRMHTTLGFQSPPITLSDIAALPVSESHGQRLSDVKLLLTQQNFWGVHNLSVNLGVQLPTGRHGAGENAVTFTRGPAAGEILDAALQPGSGNTLMHIGAQYAKAITDRSDVLLAGNISSSVAQLDHAVDDDYRVGDRQTLELSLRTQQTERLSSQVQLNLSHKNPDRGALASAVDSAGTTLHLSPGLRLLMTPQLALYGFVQLPIYVNVSGYQLVPKSIFSLGFIYGW